MNILYVTSEAVPFCKTGGLADVAGSLPQSLAANGDRVSVILPLYQSVADAWRDRLHFERYTYVRLAWRSLYCGLFSYEWQGVTWYFVDNEQYFKRPELYGYYDDGERFAFFCRAVTELLPLLPEFQHEHPNISLHIRSGNDLISYENEEGNADVAIYCGDSITDGLHATPLLREGEENIAQAWSAELEQKPDDSSGETGDAQDSEAVEPDSVE